ncbi:hypothetical protein B9T12_02305 [Wohlfahrtiimonas chitiniclastica]|uniref:DUF2262 domain-containing protein n=1 Tax=Wohlfahrtiimonas chitiniclastica TaxID=400946 RepID=UPI000B99C8EC|nr:DUF2262 domain-containing protein [Wohlfahrtiimonas chitiniclastica]OYQ80280.1 hypothetical protein B9T12_02305 [Wohlfahrtiimonas chitiniclastica]
MDHSTFVHPVLGELTYEAALQGYAGSIELSDMPLKINLVGDALEAKVLGDRLLAFLESEAFEDAFIAGLEALLTLKNRDWLSEGEAEYTLEEFFDFVSLDAIVMHSDKIELYTDDLELLWRNRAILRFDNAYQLLNVHIEEHISF